MVGNGTLDPRKGKHVPLHVNVELVPAQTWSCFGSCAGTGYSPCRCLPPCQDATDPLLKDKSSCAQTSALRHQLKCSRGKWHHSSPRSGNTGNVALSLDVADDNHVDDV
eukprot:3976475-Amphidinium_carterae.1